MGICFESFVFRDGEGAEIMINEHWCNMIGSHLFYSIAKYKVRTFYHVVTTISMQQLQDLTGQDKNRFSEDINNLFVNVFVDF